MPLQLWISGMKMLNENDSFCICQLPNHCNIISSVSVLFLNAGHSLRDGPVMLHSEDITVPPIYCPLSEELAKMWIHYRIVKIMEWHYI